MTDRSLGVFEKALLVSDAYSPMLMVGVLQLENAPPVDILRHALHRAQERHPLLRARITRRGRLRHFEVLTEQAPSLSCVARRDDEHWREVAASELNDPIDAERGPLYRIALLQGRDDEAPSIGELILTAHHTAMDARSLVGLFDELLRDCAAHADGGPRDGTTRDEPPPALETRYPARFRGLGRVRSATSFLLRQMAGELRYRWRTRRGDLARPGAPSRCQIDVMQLSRDTTRALVRRCRRERITLNSALLAAMLQADQQRHYAGYGLALRGMAFHDLRGRLEPPVGSDVVGCYISPSAFDVELPPALDAAEAGAAFWTVARRVQEAVRGAERRGDPFVAPGFFESLVRMATTLKRFRLANVALSYSGAVGLEERYGKTAVRGMRGFVSNHTLGPEFSGWAHLFRGRLVFSSLVLDADMDAAAHAVLLDTTREILEGIAEAPSE